MKRIILIAMLAYPFTRTNAQKQIPSSELISAIQEGKSLTYEQVTFVGDIDLSSHDNATQTGQYPEKGKTVYVLTNFVNQAISFKNCTFKGGLILFDKTETATEKKEYRVEFRDAVTFQNCVFEKSADFELCNFNTTVSFESSVFKEQPRFVRMGLYQPPNIEGLKLEKDCLFQFDQSKKQKIFTALELGKVIEAM